MSVACPVLYSAISARKYMRLASLEDTNCNTYDKFTPASLFVKLDEEE
jgi:hypothetical protein